MLGVVLHAQQSVFSGSVFSVQTKQPMSDVNILNINQVKGVISDSKGNFSIVASVNDTLYLSFLGYKSMKVVVTKDMLRIPGTRIGMTEQAYALEEVVVMPYQLTGYLSVDVKNLPINNGFQYSISGLEMGYEGRVGKESINRIITSVMDPVGLLYSTFSAKSKQLKQLRKWRQDESFREILSRQTNREMLLGLLGMRKEELDKIIQECNYSSEFISSASDLQILEALENCFEEHNVLLLKRKLDHKK